MQPISRRTFVAGAALTARAYSQIKGANERIRVGVIGCGGQATAHMTTLVKMRDSDNLEVLAVCDVFTKHAEQASKLTGGKIIKDYRGLQIGRASCRERV